MNPKDEPQTSTLDESSRPGPEDQPPPERAFKTWCLARWRSIPFGLKALLVIAVSAICLFKLEKIAAFPAGSISKPFPQLPTVNHLAQSTAEFSAARALLGGCMRVIPGGCPLSIEKMKALDRMAALSAKETYEQSAKTISDLCDRHITKETAMSILWVVQSFQLQIAKPIRMHRSILDEAGGMREKLEAENQLIKRRSKECEQADGSKTTHGTRAARERGKACIGLSDQQRVIEKMQQHFDKAIEAHEASLTFWKAAELSAGWMHGNASHLETLVNDEEDVGVDALRLVVFNIKRGLRNVMEGA